MERRPPHSAALPDGKAARIQWLGGNDGGKSKGTEAGEREAEVLMRTGHRSPPRAAGRGWCGLCVCKRAKHSGPEAWTGASAFGHLCDCPMLPRSEAKRPESGRQQMDYTMADLHQVRLKLQKHLAVVSVRQELALRRNWTLRQEFLQLEAHMETTGWESIRKMEWYGREIKNLLSLREGSLSAGDKEGGSSEQVPQAGGQVGICTSTAVPGELGHPAAALLGSPTPAALATGGLGSQQEPPLRSPSPEELGPETRSTAGESEEGAAGHGDLAASDEGSEQLTSVSGTKAAPPRTRQQRGSVPGAKPGLSSWWACREGSSAKLPVPAGAEEVRPSIPGTWQEQGRDTQATEGSLLPPPSPSAAQEEPLDSSAPHRPGGTMAERSELCHALQLLEDLVERTSPQHRVLYQHQPSRTAELPSAHAGAGGLAPGNLEVMEAVVLQQLQAMSQRARSGSLPLENTVEAAGRAGHKEHTRDTEALWTLLSHHGLFLKQHRVRLPEEVSEMFEQLLASGEEEQDVQAVPALREALPEEHGDEPPVQSDASSLSLPSIPTNSREGKQGELSWRETGGDCGHNIPKESDSPGTHSEIISLSDGSAPPFSRTELQKETVTAIKSKAFWGESDDSSSELEAALRPQTHSAESDDFDDFYD
ncbi:centrosomal protein kizuna isoform X2 [Hirundo rustica]|uniref:centrosomal protein kizuna isoform X2 n=1 Tax=Hirundo rustica TaxID=43150 RepID=UPI001A94712A|nr:centrosomal protein kizuna isoform X2 [Hirundo rustica]